MFTVPQNTDRYWLYDKDYGCTSGYIGNIADVKQFIDKRGTSLLSMDTSVRYDIRLKQTPIRYDTESNKWLYKTEAVRYIARPKVIYDNKYRIFNYHTIDDIDITVKPTDRSKKHCWKWTRKSGSKPHRRSKSNYGRAIFMYDKQFAAKCALDFDNISDELTENNIFVNSTIIDHALSCTRIKNRYADGFFDEDYRKFGGSPVSWKKQHKKKQWMKKYDTDYLDKHAMIYRINSDFIDENADDALSA